MERLMDAGLGPLWDRFIPEGTSGHALVLARAQSPAERLIGM
jgi:hypothetical protein